LQFLTSCKNPYWWPLVAFPPEDLTRISTATAAVASDVSNNASLADTILSNTCTS
jgi:hypothetical protein